MANGEFDDPEKLSEEQDTSEEDFKTPLGTYEVEETVHRHEHGHDEVFQRAYERKKKDAQKAYRRKYSGAQAADRARKGALQHNFQPHSEKLVEWTTARRVPGTSIRVPNPVTPAEEQDLILETKSASTAKYPQSHEITKKQKHEIAEYNNLRKRHIEKEGEPLSPEELAKYRALMHKYTPELLEPDKEVPDLVEVPKEGKTVHEQENERLQKELEEKYPSKADVIKRTHQIHEGGLALEQQGAGERENVEGTIRKYGQEELHKKRPKRVINVTEEGEAYDEPTRTGWESTYRFNKEQYKRKFKALRSGEAALGFGEPAVAGYQMGVPVEKAKFTVGPNQEHVLKTEWEQKNQEKTPGQDVYVIRVKSGRQTNRMNIKGQYFEKGKNIGETLRESGVPVRIGAPVVYDETGKRVNPADRIRGIAGQPGGPMGGIDPNPPKRMPHQGPTIAHDIGPRDLPQNFRKLDNGDMEYRLVTEQGEHLDPDQVAKLKEQLHLHHELVNFETLQGADYANKRYRAPVGFHKLPKGVDEGDIMPGSYRKNIYSGRFGARFGERNPVTGELEPGEKETIGMRLGPMALQHHLDESTDAIGWGTSWRPGSKEKTAAITALPRAARDREIYEAVYGPNYDNPDEGHLFNIGNDKKLNELVAKEHPELETPYEVEEQKNKYRKHAKELAAAGAASAFYSTKKGWPRKLGAKVYYGSHHIPKLGSKIQEAGRGTNFETYLGNARWASRPLSQHMHNAKLRVLNPLKDPRDPTMAGIFIDTKKVSLPSWHYRSLGLPEQVAKGRKWEKETATLKGIMNARDEVDQFLQSSSKNLYKKFQAKSAAFDPERRTSDKLVSKVSDLRSKIEAELGREEVDIGEGHIVSKKSEPLLFHEYREYLHDAHWETTQMLDKIKSGHYTHEELRALWKAKYPQALRTTLPKGVKVGGEIGLGAAALVGGSLFAVDRYQTYKHNKGENVNHPILKAITPESVKVPEVKVRRTRELTMPNNALTDALDLQGEKIPIAGRISVSKKEKLRLQHHTDISGQSYKSGLPLFGGIGVRAPAPVKGSLVKGVAPKTSQSDLGPTKNMYVAGKRVPIDVTIGKKERWDNKRHKLSAKNNPYKLSAQDREHLAQLAWEAPHQREQIEQFYYGDQRLKDMIESPEDEARIGKKNMYWLVGGKSHGFDSIEKIKGHAGVGLAGQQRSMTTEEAQAHRASFERLRRERKKERQRRAGT